MPTLNSLIGLRVEIQHEVLFVVKLLVDFKCMSTILLLR
jgi:hypothetical protein